MQKKNSIVFGILLTLIILLASTPQSSHAADKKNTVKVNSSLTFKIKEFECAQVKKVWLSGTTVRKGTFYPYTKQIADLLKQAKQATKSKKTALTRKANLLKAKLKIAGALCARGPVRSLKISLTSQGFGHIESDPAGINCGSTCSHDFAINSAVQLIPSPDNGNTEFKGWSGACQGTAPCSLIMDDDKSVAAIFGERSRSLSISVQGPGVVQSVSGAQGINCNSNCRADFSVPTTVQLTATPTDSNYEFSGWAGDCSGQGICEVSLAEAKSVVATFKLKKLTLTVAVTGSGSVQSLPSGISCGTDCVEDFDKDAIVTLSAVPLDDAHIFSGWSGACTGVGACVVTMSEAKSVTASFGTKINTLTVSVNGGGTVSSSPAGISCGSDCTEDFTYSTLVTLSATPTGDLTEFTGWSGACSGVGSCSIVMNGSSSVTATFAPKKYTLTVAVSGEGSVQSAPAGISCGTDCSQEYVVNTAVTLTPIASSSTDFIGWSGACTGIGTCSVTMSSAKNAVATFAVKKRQLNLSVIGNGSVQSAPAGISCGIDCSEDFAINTIVTLSASPADETTEFVGWSGACTGTGACAVTMSEAKSISATFAKKKVALNVSVNGGGSVESSPAGFSCSADCSVPYEMNTIIELVAIPTDSTYEFTGWGGSCSGVGSCAVTMSAAKSVTATFVRKMFALSVAVSGNGTVQSVPTGILCGTDCSESYNMNTEVTLTATPGNAFTAFTGWSGACAGTGSCTVTMSQARSVTATFAAATLDGDWIGTNSQGRSISFVVTSGKIMSFKFSVFVAGRFCSGTSDIEVSAPNGLTTIDGTTHSFTITSFDETFSGTFTKVNAASGSLSVYDSYCDGSANLTWNATK